MCQTNVSGCLTSTAIQRQVLFCDFQRTARSAVTDWATCLLGRQKRSTDCSIRNPEPWSNDGNRLSFDLDSMRVVPCFCFVHTFASPILSHNFVKFNLRVNCNVFDHRGLPHVPWWSLALYRDCRLAFVDWSLTLHHNSCITHASIEHMCYMTWSPVISGCLDTWATTLDNEYCLTWSQTQHVNL